METIVVGFDGSQPALEALRWAADEAEMRHWNVVLVQSWQEPVLTDVAWVTVWDDLEESKRRVQEDLEALAAEFAAERPTISFSAQLVTGAAGRVLSDPESGAAMVVVGARGLGGFSSLLLGSVSRKVAARAPSTVVVVRAPGNAEGEIVVGVDGSDDSRKALAWAADAARLRGRPLRVVMAWSYLMPEGPDGPEPFQPDYSAADASRALKNVVDEVLGEDPGVELVLEATCALAAKALIERSKDASLLVVGPRDRSMHSRIDLGSVTAQLLHHAPCPIAVVRVRS